MDTESDDITLHCATCGVHVGIKKALAHMERCFMKVGGDGCVRVCQCCGTQLNRYSSKVQSQSAQ